MSLLVLSASDVDKITSTFTPSELQSLMARVFSSFSSPPQSPPLAYAPQRVSIPTENHTALFMPARLSHPSLLGTTVKVVCVPRSAADTRGLPASTLVLDEATGAVKAIINARSLTALRNAAGSLLSTNIVSLRPPQSIVAFGAGKQIEAHLDLHLQFYPSIRTCTVVNRTVNSRVLALKQLMESRFPAVSFHYIASTVNTDLMPASHGQQKLRNALLSASIIICATPSSSPLFPSSWVRAGTHVILVGSYTPAMREVDRELVHRAIQPSGHHSGSRPVLLVDSRDACACEAGELIDAAVDKAQMVEIGEMVRIGESGVVDLLEISGAPAPPARALGHSTSLDGVKHVDAGERHSIVDDLIGSGPITMFKSVGVGLQDVAIGCAVVAKAEEPGLGIGTWVAGYDG